MTPEEKKQSDRLKRATARVEKARKAHDHARREMAFAISACEQAYAEQVLAASNLERVRDGVSCEV